MLDSSLEHKGYFWLPGKPKEQLAGILKFNQIDGITLELFGAFKGLREVEKETIVIIGHTDTGKKITLSNCFESQHKMSIPGFETSIVSAINLFIGECFENISSIKFDELCVSYESINQWFQISGFEKAIHDEETKEVTVKYKKPDNIIFNIDESWSLNIEFNYYAPMGYTVPSEKVEVRQQPELVFKSKDKEEFEVFKTQFHVFNSLLSVCYFSYPKVISIDFYIKREAQDYKKIEWYYKHGLNYSKFPKHNSKHDFLIQYKDLSVNPNMVILQWFNSYSKLSASINILTENFMKRNDSVEFRFLGLTQAIENYHRRVRGGKYAFITRIKEVLDYLPEKVKTSLITNENELLEDIRKNRNYLTHYNEELESAVAPLKELFLLSEKMKIILLSTLLKHIGLSDGEAEKIIIQKSTLLFNHIIKYETVERYIKEWQEEEKNSK